MKVFLVAALGLTACSRAGTMGTQDLSVAPADSTVFGPSDPLPTGAISFFRTAQCPDGWTTYVRAAGRFLVPSSASTPTSSGTPLASAEDRGHDHTIASSIDLPDVSYVGVSGGGNGGLTAAGKKSFSFKSAKATTTLPYIQLLACQKIIVSQPSSRTVPHGTTIFYPDVCPSGWSAPTTTQGRLLVGLPDGTTAGAYGGPPLAVGEQRAHGHIASGVVTVAHHGIALAAGCCGGGYGGAGAFAYTSTSEMAAPDLPLLQLRQCIKD